MPLSPSCSGTQIGKHEHKRLGLLTQVKQQQLQNRAARVTLSVLQGLLYFSYFSLFLFPKIDQLSFTFCNGYLHLNKRYVLLKGEGNHYTFRIKHFLYSKGLLAHHVTSELRSRPAKCFSCINFGWLLVNLKFGRRLIIFYYFRCLLPHKF